MSNHQPKVYLERPLMLRDYNSSRLINEVKETERQSSILDNVFKLRSMENPYIRKVHSNIELCTELSEIQRKKFVEEKRRQHICETNEELKTLEKQIRAAYVMKTVQAQIFEKQALENCEKVKEHAESCSLLDVQVKLQDKIDEEKIRAKKQELKQTLMEQISQKKEHQREKCQDLIKERQEMDEAVKRYKDDMEKEKQEAREKIIRTKRQMDEFTLAKAELLMEEDRAWEEEAERYRKLVIKREEDQRKAKEEKRKKIRQKQLQSEEIGKQIQAIAAEKARKSDLLADLLCEEREAKDLLHMQNELKKKQDDKFAAIAEMERTRKEKEEQKLNEQRTKDAFFQEEMRILAERDKLEQLSDEKRRKKQMEHRKSLQTALIDQKIKRAEQIKSNIRRNDKLVHEEEMREQLIKKERIRMLKEHAHVLKFCAPGVVRDSEKKFIK